MQTPKIHIRSTRNREDYDLFKITMIGYKSLDILDLTITANPGDYLSPDHSMGKIVTRNIPSQASSEQLMTEENKTEQKLSPNLAGTV